MRLKCFYCAALAFTWLNTGGAAAEDKIEPVIYAFGFSASFNDSIVYFTDIQEIDSVWMDGKTGFVLERGIYSNQMRDYFNGIGQPNRTCVFFYDVKMKKLGKKFRKMKEKYVESNSFDIKYLKPEEFSFKAAELYGLEEARAKRAKAKKEKKKESGSDKMGPPDMNGGGGPGGMGGGPGGMGGGGGMPPGGF